MKYFNPKMMKISQKKYFTDGLNNVLSETNVCTNEKVIKGPRCGSC